MFKCLTFKSTLTIKIHGTVLEAGLHDVTAQKIVLFTARTSREM
jgi:hypothetical protein